MTAVENKKVFFITRTFDAPRALVWKAWTEADRLAQWWGPKGCTIRVVKLDLKPGGIFHYTMSFKPGHEMWGRFTYREIVAPERLAFINSFSDEKGGITRAPFAQTKNFPLEVLNTVTLTEQDGKTTLKLSAVPINATEAEMENFVSNLESMRGGYGGTFDQLEAFLKTA